MDRPPPRARRFPGVLLSVSCILALGVLTFGVFHRDWQTAGSGTVLSILGPFLYVSALRRLNKTLKQARKYWGKPRST